ncbi:MAG: NUDIX hydrolase [Caldilinea sp. CFX5]|nr:NUDIX hydrolase [Caldilinea sp. CFX5]
MPPKRWKTVSTRQVYQNPWMRLREDIAEMPNGKRTIYGVIECNDCVAVLPFVDNDHVVLVRQYRYIFGENQRWEIPSGGVKAGETMEAAARRELHEEVGYAAQELQHVSTYFPSKSIMRETGHLFIGRGLTPIEATPDETEFLEVAAFPFAQALQMVIDSEIRDSMSVITILHAARLREEVRNRK